MKNKKFAENWFLGGIIAVFVFTVCISTLFPTRPALAVGPVLVSANLETPSGIRIWLVFDSLSRNNPYTFPSSDFRVATSLQGPVNVSAVARQENFLVVSVDPAIQEGQSATITYVPSASVPINEANEPMNGFTASISGLGSISPSPSGTPSLTNTSPPSSFPIASNSPQGIESHSPSSPSTQVRPTSSAAISQPVKREIFRTCALMHKKFLGGVARSFSSKNKGVGMRYIPRVDQALYLANSLLDVDRDGIACER